MANEFKHKDLEMNELESDKTFPENLSTSLSEKKIINSESIDK